MLKTETNPVLSLKPKSTCTLTTKPIAGKPKTESVYGEGPKANILKGKTKTDNVRTGAFKNSKFTLHRICSSKTSDLLLQNVKFKSVARSTVVGNQKP